MNVFTIKFKDGQTISASSAEESITKTNENSVRRLTIILSKDDQVSVNDLSKIATVDNIDPLVISQGDVSTEVTGLNKIDAISKSFSSSEIRTTLTLSEDVTE